MGVVIPVVAFMLVRVLVLLVRLLVVLMKA